MRYRLLTERVDKPGQTRSVCNGMITIWSQIYCHTLTLSSHKRNVWIVRFSRSNKASAPPVNTPDVGPPHNWTGRTKTRNGVGLAIPDLTCSQRSLPIVTPYARHGSPPTRESCRDFKRLECPESRTNQRIRVWASPPEIEPGLSKRSIASRLPDMG